MIDKSTIEFLQDYFDGRSKLEKAKNSLITYGDKKDSSFFFSYKDNWGNKQYINIPIEINDIVPLIEEYIENINKNIIKEISNI